MHSDGISLFFQGCFLQLHESLAGRDATDEGGHISQYFPERSLYLSHQLKKGCHHAIGENSTLQLIGTRDESQQVSQAESHTHHCRGGTAEERTSAHLPLQPVLHITQSGCHGTASLQGLEHHIILDTLLKNTLYPAVRVANLASEVTHASDIESAEQDKEWSHQEQEECHTYIHGTEEEECSHESGHHAQGRRNGLSDGIGHIIHVSFQAVEHISAVSSVPSHPLAVQEMSKEPHLQDSLGAHTQNGSYPSACIPTRYLQQHQQSQQDCSPP